MTEHRLRSLELKKLLRGYPAWLAATIVLIGVPLGLGWVKVIGGAFRDNVDLFAQFMQSPIVLLFPLIASMVGGQVLHGELTHRGITNIRVRSDIRVVLTIRMLLSCTAVTALFFISTLAVYVISVDVWPILGNPSIDPRIYGLTPESAAVDSLIRFSFAELLAVGTPFFGIVYSAWLGISAAIYSLIGMIALLTIPNRAAAIALPWLIYLLQSIAFSVVDAANASLMFSAYPFGYSHQPIVVAVAPTLVLATLTLCALVVVIRRAPYLRNVT